MDKVFLLKVCIVINLIFIILLMISFFMFENIQSNYLNVGWSNNFVFLSIIINTPLKYFILCTFITVLNMSEIFLNDVAWPIIQFSTYNPYKGVINDFSRLELEVYSNLVFFIQGAKKLVLVLVTLSQIDIAIFSLITSQISASIAINYLLNEKSFKNEPVHIPGITRYSSVGESSPIIGRAYTTKNEYIQV